jgi:MFS transporter
MALVFTLIKANSWGWSSGRTLAGFAAAIVLIAAFVVIERRHENPLVPLRIFSNRSLAASDATMLVVAAALFGVFFFCTLYLQPVLGYNALETGVAYLPWTLSTITASTLASRVVDRFTPKPVLLCGLLTATAGFLLLTRLSGSADYAGHVLPAMIVLGAGLGMSFVPITISATNGVAPGDSGLGFRTAEHHPTGRRLAGPRDPDDGVHDSDDERAPCRLAALGSAHTWLQGRLHRCGRALRARCRACTDAPTRPPTQGRGRADRDARAVLLPLSRRAVLRSPRGSATQRESRVAARGAAAA